jgi:hypothetical protein
MDAQEWLADQSRRLNEHAERKLALAIDRHSDAERYAVAMDAYLRGEMTKKPIRPDWAR